MTRRLTGAPAALIIFIGGFFVFGSFMMTKERLAEMRTGTGSENWPSVSGEVTRSELRRAGATPQTASYYVVFEYRYEVAGTTHTGDRVAFTRVDPIRVTEDYPGGTRVAVHYDPNEPSVSALEPGVARASVMRSLAPLLAASLVGLVLVVWGLWGLVRGDSRKRQPA